MPTHTRNPMMWILVGMNPMQLLYNPMQILHELHVLCDIFLSYKIYLGILCDYFTIRLGVPCASMRMGSHLIFVQ